MSTPQADRDRWLTAVCRGILLPKERNAARQELSDHLDDHRDALLAAGLSPEEAERRALAAMGEPAALCARFRRVHQPVLTRLVQLARGCCIALACILCLSLLLHLARGEALLPGRDGSRRTEQALASAFGRNDDPALRSRRVLDPASRTTIGSCTLTARRLSVDRWEGEDTVRLSLLLCFDNGAFWRDAPVPPSPPYWWQTADGRWSPCIPWPDRGAAAYAIAVLQTQSPPQMLTLELTTADGAVFPLSIPNEGVILYEKNHKLAVLLLLCIALLLALWLRADRPRLNAQSLLNRLERANLAEESRLLNTRFVILAGYNGSLQYEEHLAAGVTDTHLHLARLWKRSLLWYRPLRGRGLHPV